jgi:predicted methyltransferase
MRYTIDAVPILLSHFQAKVLLAAREAGKEEARVSADLGLSFEKAVLAASGVHLLDQEIPWAVLEEIREEERRVFRWEEGEAKGVQVFSEALNAVRTLCPTPSAPTTLISGIPMHRVKDTDPWKDSQAKLAVIGPNRGPVLDTCFGLGYTALLAAKKSERVTSVEIDPAALELARQNPWSVPVFDNPRISVTVGDILEVILNLPTGAFSAVIHDPPTLSLAGDLYGLDFYRELRRVLKRNGTLFHYIGDPESRLGSSVYPGVMNRLTQAGFRHLKREPSAHGVSAS